ncbi:MAG: DnaJ family domain-containing protein [Syntrophomonadaceae bacterium]|jgi:DnaJ family protein C protein 28
MEKSLDEEIKMGAQKERKLARYMSSTEDLVESQIEKAQKRGDFDNLSGVGKPIHLEENPFQPAELRMAYKILKDNNYAPFWIELGKEIDSDISKFWSEIEYFKKYTQIFFQNKHNQAAIDRYEKKKANFYKKQALLLEQVNKKILDYNLHCPTFRLSRGSIIVEDEISKMRKEIE